MPVKIISCEVMKDEIAAVAPVDGVDIQFISMGLHKYPDRLREELQHQLDATVGYSRVVLAFGLCGGAARNLRPNGFTLTIPRVHDCIPLLLGSRERFAQLTDQEKGTFYYTRGWIEGMDRAQGDTSILSEYQRIKERFGEKKADSVVRRMYAAYTRILYVKTGVVEEERFLQRSRAVARLLGLNHEVTQGDLEYIRRIVNGPYDDADFINILPGEILDENLFGIYADQVPSLAPA
ncbi:DUF1638 domain-containing protein [Geomesophilobacter sediminis]|uniref:DUF1638 domain-containing protein n=1 Tax=Geomesophilobacter sediminis TaxID=2798584 RepID=A0A8J7J6D0_9BACT|nr:DUF1638 domain-containing protein [Geomesophilobacter sediminis]MBJ6724316.1 DUF1638 domain-containing protein [Geomesophilobacter sediminis]